MKLKKPNYCDQEWLKMKDTEKGKLCGKCQNELIDFRKKSWGEIRQIQFNSNNSTCGLYSKKQLNNWDPEPKASGRFTIAAASVLFGMSQLVSSNAIAQEDTTITIKPEKIDPITNRPVQLNAIIRGKAIDKESGEPIPFAKIIVVGTEIMAATDFEGEFALKFPADFEGEVDIQARYIGYTPLIIEGIRVQQGKTSIVDLNFTMHSQITSFTVTVPTKRAERKYKRQQKREARKKSKEEE
jgi:CarboxypepD_reg-like domain